MEVVGNTPVKIRNPLPLVYKFFTFIVVGMIAMGESAGRARAASELSRMGYHEEAKALMLQKDNKDV
jgi:hypothetical protein|tara:strand:- start:1379 stop:1579 length:201 start_codon:yes stop_codon:yes gene_type:complete